MFEIHGKRDLIAYNFRRLLSRPTLNKWHHVNDKIFQEPRRINVSNPFSPLRILNFLFWIFVFASDVQDLAVLKLRIWLNRTPSLVVENVFSLPEFLFVSQFDEYTHFALKEHTLRCCCLIVSCLLCTFRIQPTPRLYKFHEASWLRSLGGIACLSPSKRRFCDKQEKICRYSRVDNFLWMPMKNDT